MANTITFNEENMERQYFALPYPVTQHILWNANAEVLWKLYQTCKHFYKKRPYCIVDKIKIRRRGLISMKIDGVVFNIDNDATMEIMENIWIAKKIECWRYDEILMRKIIQCHAEEIILHLPSLSMKDFITLTKSGSVTHWNSSYTNIMDDDGNLLSLEKLLFHLPNTLCISANVHYVIHPNPVNVASPPRKNKITWLYLDCDYPFNADLFFDLLKKTLAPKARVNLWLNDQIYAENFQAEMDAKLNSWIPQNEKPSIAVRFDPLME